MNADAQGLPLDERARAMLRSTHRWARLLAGFAWFGVFASVVVLLQMRATSGDLSGDVRGFAYASTAVGIVSMTAAAILLGRYGRKLRSLLAGHTGAAAPAFRALRFFWIGLVATYAVGLGISLLHLAGQVVPR